jgi:hypothetical protein
VTYVHERLWPALLNAVRVRSARQEAELSRTGRSLLALVQRRGALRSDEIAGPQAAALRRAMPELETRLLVHADSVHTESGTHRKLLRTWARWCADAGYTVPRLAPREGRAQLEAAARALADGRDAAVRLPWTR